MAIANKIIFGDNLEVTDLGSGTIRVDGADFSSSSSPILTSPVSLTAAQILTLYSEFVVITPQNPGTVAVPVALIGVTEVGSNIYDMTGVIPFLYNGGGEAILTGLNAALNSGGPVNQVSQDILTLALSAPILDVEEAGIAITAEANPTPIGGTPDWGFNGTLYYIEFNIP